MAERLLDLGGNLEIWSVRLDDLREQDVNARAMDVATFDRLAKTIERDGRLESLPFCALVGDSKTPTIEIISGHHRTRTARTAGLDDIHVLVDTSGLTESQIKAKQLAHNSIAGTDNPQLIAEIYGAIEDVEARLEAFIDPKKVEIEVKPVSVPGIGVKLDYRTVQIMFVAYEADRFASAIDAAAQTLKDEEVYVAELAQIDQFRKLAKTIGSEYNIRAYGTILDRTSAIVLEHLGVPDDIAELEEVMPMRDVLGQSVVAKETGDQLKSLIDKAKRRGLLADGEKPIDWLTRIADEATP